MNIINNQTGLTICNGSGKPVRAKIYTPFDDGYELDAVDKATIYFVMTALLLGIVYATFGG